MPEAFIVSVVIPVYNAEKYLSQAVESALGQKEVREIILIDDGSKDSSLVLCRALSLQNSKIKCTTHGCDKNLGPAATRNLGIRLSTCPFIAFLDADDFYLPNRFATTKNRFFQDPNADGVYEAIEAYFESEQAERRWREMGAKDLTTIQGGIEPEQLFFKQSPVGNAGHCCVDGLTLKRKVIQKIGYFNEELRDLEDTDFYIKLSAASRLIPGQINSPVAIRRVHATNNFTQVKSGLEYWRDRIIMWLSVYGWMQATGICKDRQNVIISKILMDLETDIAGNELFFKRQKVKLLRIFLILREQPKLSVNKAFIVGMIRQILK